MKGLNEEEFKKSFGMVARISRDHRGFVIKNIAVSMLLQAVRSLGKRSADEGEIDRAMKALLGRRTGPLRPLNYIRFNSIVCMTEKMCEETRDMTWCGSLPLK